ncbi:MAG: hypothetical protein JNN13_04725, partial [Planctomycetes bacterium]|nr:hypothetical protein [Planctomycetota bacterium]
MTLQTVSVDGAVLANGRFDLRLVTVVPVEGKAEPYGRQVSCDGNALYVVWDDSLHGNIWSETAGGLSARLGNEVPEVWPLYAWVEDPFDVPWFAEITYSESALGAETIVRRSFDPVVGEGIDTEYSIDTGGPVAHP